MVLLTKVNAQKLLLMLTYIQLNKIMKTDSKTKNGITVGLIDSIITVASVLSKRGDLHDQDSAAVREAMNDLTSDDNVSWLLTRKTAKQWANDREAISIAVKALSAPSTHSSSEMVDLKDVMEYFGKLRWPSKWWLSEIEKNLKSLVK